jgi:hypothetical protein
MRHGHLPQDSSWYLRCTVAACADEPVNPKNRTVVVVLEALAVVYGPVVEVGAALCGADLHKAVMLCNTGNQQHTNLQIALVAICSDFPSP